MADNATIEAIEAEFKQLEDLNNTIVADQADATAKATNVATVQAAGVAAVQSAQATADANNTAAANDAQAANTKLTTDQQAQKDLTAKILADVQAALAPAAS